ncbi:mitochondrial substrate carrier family protein [Raphidocelis subcapitata]|uniref:Mitochondrial substrate carrier family protein n=1 Tax=Raphidocelis subcapitata TaxID=307507 RepID=A0A2V0NT63_9CHLO|nr:mitochondrial substrate carrier family protein [Raphidocelis subcapitata]|eukprot:GBF88117.1 mitochondrial substrate carrier family protein [Raphidocelis subcapitata]
MGSAPGAPGAAAASAAPPGAAAAAAAAGAPHHRPPAPGELFAYGGLSCVVAAVITNPLDVLKTQLQIQGELAGRPGAAPAPPAPGGRRLGMGRTMLALVRAEGPSALMRGVAPSMLREASYSTIRYGAYDPIKARLQASFGQRYVRAHATQAAESAARGANETQVLPMSLKIAAGGMAGALGAAGATPTDLIKVRQQAAAAGGARPTGVLRTAAEIYGSEGGLRGLYRGVWPTTLRAAMLTATQLPVYDHCKYELTTHASTSALFKEGHALHFACSIIAGFACATVVAPVDQIKTRYMNQPIGPDGRGLRYSSMAACLVSTVRAEGVTALWKGWAPSCLRLGPHTCVSLLIFEQLRRFAGLAPI